MTITEAVRLAVDIKCKDLIERDKVIAVLERNGVKNWGFSTPANDELYILLFGHRTYATDTKGCISALITGSEFLNDNK